MKEVDLWWAPLLTIGERYRKVKTGEGHQCDLTLTVKVQEGSGPWCMYNDFDCIYILAPIPYEQANALFKLLHCHLFRLLNEIVGKNQ